jgi:hypothetical protein
MFLLTTKALQDPKKNNEGYEAYLKKLAKYNIVISKGTFTHLWDMDIFLKEISTKILEEEKTIDPISKSEAKEELKKLLSENVLDKKTVGLILEYSFLLDFNIRLPEVKDSEKFLQNLLEYIIENRFYHLFRRIKY